MTLVWVDFSDGFGTEAEASVVASCSAALGSGECERAPESARQTERYRAHVTAVEGRVRYLIELRASGQTAATRIIEFTATDPLPQRWTALGLVVSSLVRSSLGERRARAEGARARPPAPKPVQAGERPRHREAATEASVASGIVVGSGFGDAVDRFGFFGSGRVGLRGLRWGLAASIRYQFRPSEPRADWQSLGVGLGYQVPLPLVSLEVRGELVGERLHVTATERDATQSATRWRSGARLQLGAALELSETWRLLGGASAEYVLPRVHWSLAGRELAPLQSLQAHGFIGLGVAWR